MATSGRAVDPGLEKSVIREQLLREPFRFEFFQAVRLLKRICPKSHMVGEFGRPANEVARFAAHPSYCFPASEIQSIVWSDGKPPVMTVNFMGLTGPQGILPLSYTEKVVERVAARDTALRDFLDIFNHRIISLFYRAWEKYQPSIAHEREERDSFSRCLLDFIGLGTPHLQDRQCLLDESLLHYAGLLAQQPRSATALRQILSDYFGVEVEIEQFAAAWRQLDSQTQCAMDDVNSNSTRLGFGAVVGDEVWDQQSFVRIKLGPLTMKQYLDFLPTGTAYEPLRTLTQFFCDELDFEVQLVLNRDEVPPCELGGETECAPQLGWVSWMKWAPFQQDAADTVLRL